MYETNQVRNGGSARAAADFSSLPVMGTGSGSVGAEGVGGTGAEQIPSGTVLIKNKWKNNFYMRHPQESCVMA